MAAKKAPAIDRNAFFSKMQQVNSKDFGSTVEQDVSLQSVKDLMEKNKGNRHDIDIFDLEFAPEEMNDYPGLKADQPDKYFELKMSIQSVGVLTPLIVWEQESGKYMVLAGRNRREVSMDLYEEAETEEEKKKYRFVPCVVFGKDEITKEQAQQIIDDTNIQREFSKMPVRIKVQITKRKMEKLMEYKKSKSDAMESLVEELGIEKSAIYESLKISDKLIEEAQELYYNGTLSRKDALRFAFFSMSTQKWILETFPDRIDSFHMRLLQKDMTREDIEEAMKKEKPKEAEVKFIMRIPAGLEDEIREYITERIRVYRETT